MRIVELCKRNILEIKKVGSTIAGAIFTILSIVLSFVSWSDFGIDSLAFKLLIFIGIIFISSVTAVLVVCYFRKSNTVYENGTGRIILRYGDFMKLAFPKRNKKHRIVIIPVNTSFDTIVDKNISEHKKLLVSPITIHGMWVENMLKEKKDLEQLDTAIMSQLQNERIVNILTKKEKCRGKLECYETGTIVSIVGQKNITYWLMALSEFDENNNAQSEKDEVIKCTKKILDYCDRHGQGYELYMPLMGTGLSRAGLSHEESLRVIETVLRLHSEKIHGNINIVIYYRDKTKVSIFK